ncbi:MAG: hypothetical protein WD512_07315, partial [Candidatus Paceibacterota bacterium]
ARSGHFLGPDSKFIKSKLEIILNGSFQDELRIVFDRILVTYSYVSQLKDRYNELIVHNHSITPNLIPYTRPNKTTYVDMATGPYHSKTQDFPAVQPILSQKDLKTVREPNGKAIATLTTNISKLIAKDLEQTQNLRERERERKDRITKDSVADIISRIGVMPEKRVEELRKNKNKYFEGTDELLTQEYLNTIQLRKNLNINYSRFYHSFFSNLDDAEELESHPVIKNIFFPNLSDDRIKELLENWKLILNSFNPDIPNKMVERVYVYQNKRYGDRNLLVASNIEDQSDEWVPRAKQPSGPSGENQAIITNKLRKFLIENNEDSEKCYQSMAVNEQIEPKDANEFLMYILLQDISNVYSSLESNKVNTRMYSVFVYGLFQLML